MTSFSTIISVSIKKNCIWTMFFSLQQSELIWIFCQFQIRASFGTKIQSVGYCQVVNEHISMNSHEDTWKNKFVARYDLSEDRRGL